MTPDETELDARRAAVARMAAVCPVCGRSLAGHGGTYAQPFPGFDDALRAIAIYEEAERVYQAALAAMHPVRTFTTDTTAPAESPL